MIRPLLPYLLVAILAGLGIYGILARRHAVLMLIGVELLLGAAGLLLVTVGQTSGGGTLAAATSGPVLTLFLITIAAAEIVVALAVIVALYRARGHVDLHAHLDSEIETESDNAELATKGRQV
ncbi:NADH-quinone oxidoreductase subunit NuoK [Ornithinimicrobium sp. Y1847]|uniref:NADH-quinone oxidoreductase subunit NuoK n=1 Tax=unclassified Ornithinimicrobium TaxID=2615080 RepID=UPI003B676919